jgi:DNA-binding transcriptional LysR family regulator
MNITLARTFLAIADTGSFVHAAERLHVTQSTVSSRMKTLEDLLGRSLLERSNSGATLTPAGQQFHKHALTLVREWEHARLEVRLAETHRDHLSIGAQPSFWDGFLLPWLAWMHGNLPNIAVTAMTASSIGLMDRLIEGTLDLAVMYRPINRPGLIIEHLFDEELIMVSTSGERRPPILDYVFVNWGREFEADHALAFPDSRMAGLRAHGPCRWPLRPGRPRGRSGRGRAWPRHRVRASTIPDPAPWPRRAPESCNRAIPRNRFARCRDS